MSRTAFKIAGICLLAWIMVEPVSAQSFHVGVGRPDTNDRIRVYGQNFGTGNRSGGYGFGRNRVRDSTEAQRRYNPLRGGANYLEDSPTESVLLKHQENLAKYEKRYERWENDVAKRIAKAKRDKKRKEMREKQRRAKALKQRLKKQNRAKRKAPSSAASLRGRAEQRFAEPTQSSGPDVSTQQEISKKEERSKGEGRLKTRKSLGESLQRAFFNFN